MLKSKACQNAFQLGKCNAPEKEDIKSIPHSLEGQERALEEGTYKLRSERLSWKNAVTITMI